MKGFRYLEGATTLTFDPSRCAGCGTCVDVCPQGVFEQNGKTVAVRDRDACMECGACQNNCPAGAISVTPGVGCAAYIISGWIHGKENASCGCGC